MSASVDAHGTPGVIAVGFAGDSTWRLQRVNDVMPAYRNYRYIVECIETGHFLGFVDIGEAAIALKEVCGS